MLLGCQAKKTAQYSIPKSATTSLGKDVWKLADTSFVKLKNGAIKRLVDNPVDDGRYILYTFQSKLADLSFLVFKIQYYEGSQVLLLDEIKGNEYFINDEPKLSPKNKFIATASLDLEAQYNPNALNIWQISPDTLKLVYSIKPKNWGPSDLVWLSDSLLSFSKRVLTDQYQDSLAGIHLLKFIDSTWTLK
jgi:hypothetical protein